jgi:cell division protein FtsA
MSKSLLQRTVAAIDIGTTKICVLIAAVDEHNNIDILGIGHCPSYGMKNGVIVNIGQTVDSIRQAVKQAENMSGMKIQSAAVGISGGHIRSFNSKGVVAIRQGDVTQSDIDRVIDAAKAVPIPDDRDILHVIPQYFCVDNQELVQDSIGMFGVRLEAQVHIITGAVSSAQNIVKSCEIAGVKVNDVVLEQLASADAVLTQSERELGVGILDIGGGTSDFAIYQNGRIRHSKVLPIAGNHFTNDVAIGCGISVKSAEYVKRSYGFVVEEKYLDFDVDSIHVPVGFDAATKKVDLYTLFEILAPRAEEIVEILHDEIMNYRLKAFMPAGFVLTGGGALLQGMPELFSKKLGVPVRIGTPIYTIQAEEKGAIPDGLKSPVYSTGYGLLVYSVKQDSEQHNLHANKPVFQRVYDRMKSWIRDFI